MAIMVRTDGEQVFLYFDEDGRAELLRMIRKLEPATDPESHDHEHLFSKEWGTGELKVLDSETEPELRSVHHLKMALLPSRNPIWENSE